MDHAAKPTPSCTTAGVSRRVPKLKDDVMKVYLSFDRDTARRYGNDIYIIL